MAGVVLHAGPKNRFIAVAATPSAVGQGGFIENAGLWPSSPVLATKESFDFVGPAASAEFAAQFARWPIRASPDDNYTGADISRFAIAERETLSATSANRGAAVQTSEVEDPGDKVRDLRVDILRSRKRARQSCRMNRRD